MFQVKICGITTVEDALLAAEAGADAIGLNFVEGSPRCISSDRALEIWNTFARRFQLGESFLWIVGVHVNQSFDEITTSRRAPNWQLHGDEPASLVSALRKLTHPLEVLAPTLNPGLHIDDALGLSFRTIKAFRCRDDSLDQVLSYLRECHELGGLPHAVLLDAHQPGSYGGTGQKLDWNMVREQRDKLMGLPLILAGGLTPENVAEAIETARPDAVDVSSGVESSPGRKDPAKVRAFVAAAKKAFEGLDK